ncbi:MAG: hypothetical protein WBA74_14655, partial [Cyclobacteriaceae bacterium]
HSFFLSFNGVEYKLAPCSLIALKSKLISYDLEQILLSDDDFSNLEIIPICNRDRFLVLSFPELAELKELIRGTFVMLELNSIVCSV